MSDELKHPLDAIYNAKNLSKELEIIRQHIHHTVASKMTNLNRNEYIILFNEQDEEKRDIAYQAGNPIQIMFCCNALNGFKVEQLARRAFSLPDSHFQMLKRFYNVTRKADAVKWYGIEVSGDPVLNDLHDRMKEVKKYPTKIEREVWIKLTITDPETGRKVTVRQQNGNAFDATEEAIRIMRSNV